MRDLLYLKDEQIKDFIEQIFHAYRETYSDPKQVLKKYSFGSAHLRVIILIERHEGITVSGLLNKLKITKQSLGRVLNQLIDEGYVRQDTDMKDGRRRLLTLTKAGVFLENLLTERQSQRIERAYSFLDRLDLY